MPWFGCWLCAACVCQDVNAAVQHLLRVQFRLGLFDPPEQQVYTKVRHGSQPSIHSSPGRQAGRHPVTVYVTGGLTVSLAKLEVRAGRVCLSCASTAWT